jgi:hypothetical protein
VIRHTVLAARGVQSVSRKTMRRFPIDFLFWAANEAGLIKGCKNHDVDDFYLLGVHLMSFGMSEKIARSHRIQLASPTSEVFELSHMGLAHGKAV